MSDYIIWGTKQQWNDTDRVEPKDSEKTCPIATLSTTNPTWTDLGMNPGIQNEKLMTNCLSYGMARYWPEENVEPETGNRDRQDCPNMSLFYASGAKNALKWISDMFIKDII
jgi:hypothetical protein